MLLKVLTGLALAFPAPAAAQETLMPGVTYDRGVEFTRHGPVVYDVLTAPRPGGLYALAPVLSNDAVTGVEPLTAIEKRLSPSATVAGVNGDLFNANDGHPTGILVQSHVMKTAPLAGRSSIGFDSTGALRVERVALFGIWQGTGQRRPLAGLNGPPSQNAVTLYTRDWGEATPFVPGSFQVALAPFAATLPNTDLSGVVTGAAPVTRTTIPAGGAVLVARGSQAVKLQAEAPVGASVTVRLTLKPDWSSIVDAIGGGPVIVRGGRAVFRAGELFPSDRLTPRIARTGIGQLRDGRVLLVTVDGGQAGYSSGATNFELGQLLARLGAVTASALDSGPSTTMAFDGQLLNRPSGPGGERAISDALLVAYSGVYAPPVAEQVLSPNGDGVGERQSASYKVVRPSTVTAKLVAPDGSARFAETLSRPPGSFGYELPSATFGSPPLEGRWRWTVDAVDDQGRSSSIERAFWLNDTLGFLRVSPPTLRVSAASTRSLAIEFTLAHAATLKVTVETRSGAKVATVFGGRRNEGPAALAWDGRNTDGRPVFSGSYTLHVSARNQYGPVDLAAPFSVRRVAAQARR